jgi:hypothetical protein
MARSNWDRVAISAATNSVFLNNLEEWIDEIISQNSQANKELLRTIKQRFERSIQANIEYHRFMISANGTDDQERADRHKLMADVYKALL